MNKSFVFISMILAFFIISLAAPGVQAQDKEKKLIEMKSTKGSGGEDKNIKSISTDNDTTGRGSGPGLCYVKFENYTGYKIWVYVDGYCEGLLSPWADGGLYTGTGSTSLYAVATFTSGKKLVWGPYSVDCDYMYTLKLYK